MPARLAGSYVRYRPRSADICHNKANHVHSRDSVVRETLRMRQPDGIFGQQYIIPGSTPWVCKGSYGKAIHV